jgi:hypothetical protein
VGEAVNAQQKRVLKVLDRMKQLVKEDANNADAFSEMLEEGLENLNSQDFFGTEGQNDPRGDFRNGDWGMFHAIEGVDDSRNRNEEGEEE